MNQKERFDLVVSLGETLLSNGGEISRTNELMYLAAEQFGLEQFNAFTIANGVFVSALVDGQQCACQVRHVPLTSIHLGRVEALNELSRHISAGEVTPEQARDASTDTDRSAAILCQSYYRILRVVNNLSDAPMLAEEKPLDTENVELVRFLDGLCRQGEALAQLMELRLTFTCPERAHTVAVNREYLARLFWNLVSNAMKFTPRGGTVDVCLRSGQGCVLLSVKDSGSGIPQDKQAQLFDRWQHSHMDLPAHGLGLGLPLCRRIAQGHGGSLVVSSREGQGTTVTVRLPDRRSGVTLVRDMPFHYAGGFNPTLVELADALPYQAFTKNYIE